MIFPFITSIDKRFSSHIWEGLAPGLASATTPPGTMWSASSRRMHRRGGKIVFQVGKCTDAVEGISAK